MDGICGNFFCAFDKIRQDLHGCLRKIFCARTETERGQNRQEAAQSGYVGRKGKEIDQSACQARKGGQQRMIHYIVTKNAAADRTRYGITAVCEQTELDSIDDIAPTFEETARLAALLSENGVAAEHFRDVVEDYLAR